MTPDDQYSIDEDDDQLDLPFHELVTQERVNQAMKLSWDDHFTREGNYDILVKLLEPQTEDEKRIIMNRLECEQIKRDWCGE